MFCHRNAFALIVSLLVVSAAAQGQKTSKPDITSALEKEDFGAAIALLKRGANPNVPTADGFTALTFAVSKSDRALARALIARGARVNEKDKHGYTALMMAAALLNSAAPGEQQIGRDLVQELVARGAAAGVHSPEGFTPLTLAASFGDRGIVEMLLRKGARVDEKGKDDDTPLLIAARRGHTELVKLFLERRADPNAPSKEGHTALHYAARDGNRPLAALLLAGGATPKAVGQDGRTTLMFAAASGSLPLVQDLLAAGVDPNAQDSAGRTALMAARGDEAAAIVRALVEQGADVSLRDRNGGTALMRAARGGTAPAVAALLAAGADPNVKDSTDRTALMRAMALDSAEIVRALQAGGASDSSEPEAIRAAYVRGSLGTSLALLQSCAATFREKMGGTCYSCHHQSLPAFAVAVARDRGIAMDAEQARKQHAFVLGLLARSRPLALKASTDRAAARKLLEAFPGEATHIAYGLFGLASWDRKPDPATETLALYLPHMQKKDGRWKAVCNIRAPSENSDFTPTALALLALRDCVPASRAKEVTAAVARGRNWLSKTLPTNTEEKTFRLLGLIWAGAPPDGRDVRSAMATLLADQRSDGGWAQIPALKSDAYATGQVLVALHLGGRLPVADPAYRRGVDFLLRTQDEDGSWYVKSRSVPFQSYIETGFPYGKDQFIACLGTSWAAAALALTFPR